MSTEWKLAKGNVHQLQFWHLCFGDFHEMLYTECFGRWCFLHGCFPKYLIKCIHALGKFYLWIRKPIIPKEAQRTLMALATQGMNLMCVVVLYAGIVLMSQFLRSWSTPGIKEDLYRSLHLHLLFFLYFGEATFSGSACMNLLILGDSYIYVQKCSTMGV